MYVYIRSEPGLWTVGFYDPTGKFQTDSDHNDKNEAANRVSFLNGNPNPNHSEKAAKWDALDAKIGAFYSEDISPEDDEAGLLGIGEIAAGAFGYL